MSEWRTVSTHIGKYEVSSSGEIRKTNGRAISQWPSPLGYLRSRLSGPRVIVLVHRVVAEAFLEKPDGCNVVNHLDCNPSNNSVENLEWCTQKQNLEHSARLGRMQKDYWVGKRTPVAKLSDDQVKRIRGASRPYSSLAKEFGVSKRTIGRVKHMEAYGDV